MASYKLTLTESAERELFAAPFPFRRQIHQRILSLRKDPLPSSAEMVREENRFRLRVHGWIILYELIEETTTVRVVSIRQT